MSYKWLFVVQNFEVKTYSDSAAKMEIVEPIKKSGFVKDHRLLCFDRTYEGYYAKIVNENINIAFDQIGQLPVVIYGAGIHTSQHISLFNKFNVVAISDREPSLWGKTLEGFVIIPPDQIPDFTQHVIISSKAYEDSIYVALREQFNELAIYKMYDLSSRDQSFYEQMSQDIKESILSFQPDILFYCPTHPSDCLPVQYWKSIKGNAPHVKYITVWWDYDEEPFSPYLNFERDCLTWNDLCLENSNVTRLLAMQNKLGAYHLHTNTHKVIFHPTVFDPEVFYNDDSVVKKYPIALFGSAAGQRKKWIDLLTQEYGDQFHHIGGVLHGEATLPIKDYAQALRETKICINTQTYPFREQCKGKVREALACGVLLLEQKNQQTRFLLKEGEGVLYFSSKTELKEKLAWLLSTPATIEEIVEKGQQVWKESMNCQQWTKKLLENVNLR